MALRGSQGREEGKGRLLSRFPSACMHNLSHNKKSEGFCKDNRKETRTEGALEGTIDSVQKSRGTIMMNGGGR